MKAQKPILSWSSLFLVTFLAAYMYIFMEWLFVITKPSYINDLSLARQVQILLITSALLASLCFLGLLPLVILGHIPLFKRYPNALIKLGGWVPAAISAAVFLLLVDNFTYTLFKYGIVSTEGWIRALYGLGFILLMVICYRSTLNVLGSLSLRTMAWGWAPKWILGLLVSVLLLSLAILLLTNQTGVSMMPIASAAGSEQRPNVLLITSDGVNASNMSVYGYARDTTPRMRELAKSALLAENAFSNSGTTAGSVISIYTGKYPAKTRLLYSPDILKGVDSFEHLPGILHSQGYKTVQITVPHYLDANEFNLLDGFDEVNASTAVHSKYLPTFNKLLPSDYALFSDEISKRVLDRVRHILFVKKMDNPYLQVISMPQPAVDLERLEDLMRVILTAEQPVFVHVHLMGTHGDRLNPQEQKFSAGQLIPEQKLWNVDFYDDSILEFDKNVGNLVDDLTELGLLEKTILIIGSDHGQKWDQLKRLPLIIRFPGGQYAGRIQANVQNLDIAPTLLDYIGLEKPDWMSGKSLIAGELDQRPIFGVYAVKQELDPNSGMVVNWEEVTAPFYQFGNITLIYCQKWRKLDLTNLGWESGEVEGSSTNCPPGSEITDEQAFQWIAEHLRENGFDISSLDHFPSGSIKSKDNLNGSGEK